MNQEKVFTLIDEYDEYGRIGWKYVPIPEQNDFYGLRNLTDREIAIPRRNDERIDSKAKNPSNFLVLAKKIHVF